MSNERPKGYFTFRLTGALFLVSAVLEVASIATDVPLFGAMRGGFSAVAYHLIYATLFGVMGAGLWRLDDWCPSAILAGTAFYTVDRLVYLLGDRTLGYEAVLGVVEPEMIDSAVLFATGTAILCWWGFAVYVYARRASFATR